MEKNKHYFNCHIAGFSYWDGPEAFQELEIGTNLELKREIDNKFDPYAVALHINEYKLGYLPRSINHDISKFIDMGYINIFEVKINRVSKDIEPEHQIGISVKIKKIEEE